MSTAMNYANAASIFVCDAFVKVNEYINHWLLITLFFFVVGYNGCFKTNLLVDGPSKSIFASS